MVNDVKKLRVCLVSSAGGHTSQLIELADSWKDSDVCWVTTGEVVKKKLSKYGRVRVVGSARSRASQGSAEPMAGLSLRWWGSHPVGG